MPQSPRRGHEMGLHSRAVCRLVVASMVLTAGLVLPVRAIAHCDTLDGPVVKDARKALAEGKVTRVLKWVKAKDEGQVRAAFRKALAGRGSGAKVRRAADMRFFETLVRVHRAG